MKRASASSALLGWTLLFEFWSGASASAQDRSAIETKLAKLEAEAQQLRANAAPPTPSAGDADYVVSRLATAEQYYRLQDYTRSNIILTEIVEGYPQHSAAPDATYLLGESLFASGDYLGARTRFRQMVDRAGEPAYRPYAGRVLGRLVEIAIRTRDFSGVDGYFEKMSRLPPQEVEGATAYFRAKYLYNKAVPVDETPVGANLDPKAIDIPGMIEARHAFEGVAENSPYYPQARYFIAVTYVLERQFAPAIEAFARVAKIQATAPEHTQVVELSQLALGRLYYESDSLNEAIDAYHRVPSSSKWFDAALYEIAWVYIRMGDSTRAEQALDLLAISLPDSRYAADASLLRGNLLMRNGSLEDASTVFKETADKYRPVRHELDDVLAKHSDTDLYFRELVRENASVFEPTAFIPSAAEPFIDENLEFKHALHALAELAKTDALVKELERIVARVQAALSSPNFVIYVPDLRFEKMRVALVRNQAAKLRLALMRAVDAKTGSANPERQALAPAIDRLPEKSEAYTERDEKISGELRGLAKALAETSLDLHTLEARLSAADFALARLPAKPEAEATRPQLTADLAGAKTEVEEVRTAATDVLDDLHRAQLEVGFGDERYVADEESRQRFVTLVEQERASSGRVDAATAGLLTRLAAVEAVADGREREVDVRIAERKREAEKLMIEEQQQLTVYREQLTALAADAEGVVGPIAKAGFLWIRDRFYDLVLRSDLGAVDVSWTDREEHRERVEVLTRERARELSALDDEFKEIMEEPGRGNAP